MRLWRRKRTDLLDLSIPEHAHRMFELMRQGGEDHVRAEHGARIEALEARVDLCARLDAIEQRIAEIPRLIEFTDKAAQLVGELQALVRQKQTELDLRDDPELLAAVAADVAARTHRTEGDDHL